jgi:hypothetical protein
MSSISGTGKALGPKYAGAIKVGTLRLGLTIGVCAIERQTQAIRKTQAKNLFIRII